MLYQHEVRHWRLIFVTGPRLSRMCILPGGTGSSIGASIRAHSELTTSDDGEVREGPNLNIGSERAAVGLTAPDAAIVNPGHSMEPEFRHAQQRLVPSLWSEKLTCRARYAFPDACWQFNLHLPSNQVL